VGVEIVAFFQMKAKSFKLVQKIDRQLNKRRGKREERRKEEGILVGAFGAILGYFSRKGAKGRKGGVAFFQTKAKTFESAPKSDSHLNCWLSKQS